MPKGKNYTEEDKKVLRNLVSKFKDIVDSKKTDVISVNQKKLAWNNITAEFNSSSERYPRTPDQLKKLWENIKFRRKLKLISERGNILKTDGGPLPEMCISPDPAFYGCGNSIKIPGTTESDTTALAGTNKVLQYDIEDEDQMIESGNKTVTYPIEEEEWSDPNGAIPEERRKMPEFDTFSNEEQLHTKKAKYSLELENEIGEMRKEEMATKIEIARQLLQTSRNEEEFHKEKRRLELEILKLRLEKLRKDV